VEEEGKRVDGEVGIRKSDRGVNMIHVHYGHVRGFLMKPLMMYNLTYVDYEKKSCLILEGKKRR
jgi:hypothetical protein